MLVSPLVSDCLTCAIINAASDSLAQRSSPPSDSPFSALDLNRTATYVTFGLFDGGLSHVWFTGLDAAVGADQSSLPQLGCKVALDAALYTPLWCVWFLAYMSVASSYGVASFIDILSDVRKTLKESWLELYRGNLGFFLPLTALIYGTVDVDRRVLAFGIASLVYTTVLSAWNAGRGEEGDVLCAVSVFDESDDPGSCGDIGAPARSASLMVRDRRGGGFGVRRLGVRAKYAARLALSLRGGLTSTSFWTGRSSSLRRWRKTGEASGRTEPPSCNTLD